MNQNEIENIIIEFIGKKIQEEQLKVQELKRSIYEKIEGLKKSYHKIIEFEKKHKKELDEIYFSTFSMFGRSEYYHLSWTLNCIGNEIENTQMYLEHTLKHEYINDGNSVMLSYAEFEEGTGLSHKSMKKYLEILIDNAKIKREKISFGGYVYSIIIGLKNEAQI